MEFQSISTVLWGGGINNREWVYEVSTVSDIIGLVGLISPPFVCGIGRPVACFWLNCWSVEMLQSKDGCEQFSMSCVNDPRPLSSIGDCCSTCTCSSIFLFLHTYTVRGCTFCDEMLPPVLGACQRQSPQVGLAWYLLNADLFPWSGEEASL